MSLFFLFIRVNDTEPTFTPGSAIFPFVSPAFPHGANNAFGLFRAARRIEARVVVMALEAIYRPAVRWVDAIVINNSIFADLRDGEARRSRARLGGKVGFEFGR